MQNRRRKNANAVASVLAAAGLAAWLGAPAARGDFTVTAYDMSDDYGAGTSVAGTTQAYTTWVFAAQTSGNTGTAIEAAQVILDAGTANPGAFGIDVESNGRSDEAARYTANIDGSVAPSNGIAASQAAGQSVYGDPAAGTFGGIGYLATGNEGAPAAFDPGNISGNPFVTPGAGNIFKTYTNQQTQDYTGSNNAAANYSSRSLQNFDASFKNTGTVNTGQINNGSVYALELEMSTFTSGSVTPQSTAGGPIPFMQVVVKTGTAFTANMQLAGNQGNIESFTAAFNGTGGSAISEVSASPVSGSDGSGSGGVAGGSSASSGYGSGSPVSGGSGSGGTAGGSSGSTASSSGGGSTVSGGGSTAAGAGGSTGSDSNATGSGGSTGTSGGGGGSAVSSSGGGGSSGSAAGSSEGDDSSSTSGSSSASGSGGTVSGGGSGGDADAGGSGSPGSGSAATSSGNGGSAAVSGGGDDSASDSSGSDAGGSGSSVSSSSGGGDGTMVTSLSGNNNFGGVTMTPWVLDDEIPAYTGFATPGVVFEPSVPEPSSTGVLAFGAIGLLRRRRHLRA